MARAEITLEPSARNKMINFLAMSALKHPSADVVMKADNSGITLVCENRQLFMERVHD